MTTTLDVEHAGMVRKHIEDLIAAFNAHDVDKILSHFTSDVVWSDPSLPEPANGQEEARRVVTAILAAFPDLHFAPKTLRIYVAPDGKSAVSSWEWSGTMTGPIEPPGYAPTGKRVTVEGTCRYEFHDRLIRKHAVIYDVLGMLQQLGIMPKTDSMQVKVMAGAQRLTRGLTSKTKTLLRG